MPEELSGYLIGGRIHVKDNSNALAFSRIRSFQFQHNGGGEILVPQIGKFIILTDIHHPPQIFNQASVGIIRRCLIKESPAIGVGVKENLHGINDRRLSAAGMSGKEVDLLIKG